MASGEISDGAGEDDGTEHLEVVVPALMDGMRVDRALSMLTSCSRSQAVKMVESGVVVVNGIVVTKASMPLVDGALIEAVLPAEHDDSVAPNLSVDFDVVLEDEDIVIVNKPAALVVHPGAGNQEGTMVAGLLARYPEIALLPAHGDGELSRPGIVHRLDKGTSGLVVVARTALAFRSLSSQLATHEVDRRYVGILEGHVESTRGIVDAPIGRSATSPTRMTIRPDGKPAVTHYEVLGLRHGPARSIVGLTLETGRTHQIRVHMAAIGHPVVNDPRYGQRNERGLDPERLALHAGSLAFLHPRTDTLVRAVAPWPNDLATLVGDQEAERWLAAT